MKDFLPCNDCTTFCKNTLHKSYNFTSYSNITVERTLHKIIITHITFIFTKRSFFKQFKHLMHIIDTQLLCRHLGCHNCPCSKIRYWLHSSRPQDLTPFFPHISMGALNFPNRLICHHSTHHQVQGERFWNSISPWAACEEHLGQQCLFVF